MVPQACRDHRSTRVGGLLGPLCGPSPRRPLEQQSRLGGSQEASVLAPSVFFAVRLSWLAVCSRA